MNQLSDFSIAVERRFRSFVLQDDFSTSFAGLVKTIADMLIPAAFYNMTQFMIRKLTQRNISNYLEILK